METENNRVIAEFMIDNINYRIHQPFENSFKYFQKHENEFDTWTTMSSSKEKNEDPKYLYNTSWDWLMPVVAKIDSKVNNITLPKESEGWYAYHGMESLFMSGEIIPVYNRVIEFIEWYNKNIKR